jgi:Spy/CpxP family protein refolding chaperone
MKLIRGLVLVLTAALLTTAAIPADEPKKDEGKGRAREQPRVQIQPGQFGQFGQQALLSKDAVDKLKFTDEQKKKYDKIDAEYKDKQKEANDKFMEMLQGGDIEKIREAVQNRRTDSQKLRTDYLAKVEGVLTDEQKKTFEEVKKEQPRTNPGGGFNIGRNPRTPPTGDVLSKPAQEKLKLTDEQKKKIEELQKNVEAQLNSILTDEQKKQLEELKKEASQTPETPPRRNRPGGDGR